MKNKTITHISASILAFCFISAANAMGAGLYLGGQLGQTNTHNIQKSVQTGTVFPNGSVTFGPNLLVNPSNTGVGTRFYLGYNLNDYFAFEAGFTHYAASKYNMGTPNPPLISGNPTGNPTITTSGYDIVGKGMFPFSSTGFGLFGKAGVAVLPVTTSASLSTTYNASQQQFIVPSATTIYFRPTAAIGASYDLTPNWMMDLTVSRVFGGGGIRNADLYSLGISYHFVDKYCGQFLC